MSAHPDLVSSDFILEFPGKNEWTASSGSVRAQFSNSLSSSSSAASASPYWVIDSGASHHMTYDSSILLDCSTESLPGDLRTADGSCLKVELRGSIQTPFLSLPDVLYIPDLCENLLSVGKLTDLGYQVVFESTHCIVQHPSSEQVVGFGRRQGGVYILQNLHIPTNRTGMKVLQTLPANMDSRAIQWEPIKEGNRVKLRSSEGKFLRKTSWSRTVIHDDIVQPGFQTEDWGLWGVDIVDPWASDSESSNTSSRFSFSSLDDYFASSPDDTGLPSVISPHGSIRQDDDGMEFFDKARVVRLRNHPGNKYLMADYDEKTVCLSRDSSSHKVYWTVEFVEGKPHVIRLKSWLDLYLTATYEPFLLGTTGMKVLQTLPTKMDRTIEWEPIKEGFHVKLQTNSGDNFLRANGGIPPWRNSVTHDLPRRTSTQDRVLWGVDIVKTWKS